MNRHRPFTLALCALLAACNQQAGEKQASVEGGEVLPGSISDDMIDLDTSTAAPPLAPVKPKTGAKASPDTRSEETEQEPTDAAAAADAPAAASGRTE